MGRVLLSIALGIFALAVFIGVGELLGVPGQNTIREILGASLASALYLAVSQFFVAPRGSRGLGGEWPTMVAMGTPLLAMSVLMIVAEGGRPQLYSALAVFVPGCLAILAGAAAAGRLNFSAVSLGSCRRYLLACATLLAAVALVLALAVIPLTRRAGTFPDGAPGGMVPVSWGIAGFSALIAVGLALVAAQAGRSRRPSFGVLGSLAFLAFIMAFFLAIPAIWFVGHGPLLRAVSIISPMCSAAEFVVTALLGATALRLPEADST
ncbi:MAG TPA: hypothetical protein VF579_08695 [Candidatus Methylomirabilis sp.]